MFEFSERSLEFQERVSRFMDDHVYPNEELHARQVADGDRKPATGGQSDRRLLFE